MVLFLRLSVIINVSHDITFYDLSLSLVAVNDTFWNLQLVNINWKVITAKTNLPIRFWCCKDCKHCSHSTSQYFVYLVFGLTEVKQYITTNIVLYCLKFRNTIQLSLYCIAYFLSLTLGNVHILRKQF